MHVLMQEPLPALYALQGHIVVLVVFTRPLFPLEAITLAHCRALGASGAGEATIKGSLESTALLVRSMYLWQ